MTTGTNFLNEHIIEKRAYTMPSQIAAGSHPTWSSAGRSALSYPRPRNDRRAAYYDRVAKIAEGAALMTETTVDAASTKPVPVISRIAP